MAFAIFVSSKLYINTAVQEHCQFTYVVISLMMIMNFVEMNFGTKYAVTDLDAGQNI